MEKMKLKMTIGHGMVPKLYIVQNIINNDPNVKYKQQHAWMKNVRMENIMLSWYDCKVVQALKIDWQFIKMTKISFYVF